MPPQSPQNQQPLPQMPISDNPPPDYNFIYQQPKRSHHFPTLGKSFGGRLAILGVGFILLVILIILVKGLVSSSPFSQSDYDIVAERQQEILHILTSDISSSNTSQLSITNQNFFSTTIPSITTAQSKALNFLSDYHHQLNSKTLAGIHNTSVDQELSSAVSSNNLNSAFESVMTSQLNYYLIDLRAAYNSTTVVNGRSFFKP